MDNLIEYGSLTMSQPSFVSGYRANGYAINRDVLKREDIDALLREADRLQALWHAGNGQVADDRVRWLVAGNPDEPVLRGLQNGYRISPLIDAVRTGADVFALLEPLIGGDLDVVPSSLFWKPPGEDETAIAYHQDAVFRKPAEAFRNIASSYVQCGIALDPHGPDNGGMKFVLGTHMRGDLRIERGHSVMAEAFDVLSLEDHGLAPSDVIDVELAPGDAVIWHPYLLHGSPPNRSANQNRRFLVHGYMRAADCDLGTPAYRGGRPVPWEASAPQLSTGLAGTP